MNERWSRKEERGKRPRISLLCATLHRLWPQGGQPQPAVALAFRPPILPSLAESCAGESNMGQTCRSIFQDISFSIPSKHPCRRAYSRGGGGQDLCGRGLPHGSGGCHAHARLASTRRRPLLAALCCLSLGRRGSRVREGGRVWTGHVW